MRRCFWGFALTLLAGAFLSGCERSEKETDFETGIPVAEQADIRIAVPLTVQSKWRAVKIAVHDKQSGTDSLFKVDIGASFTVPGTGISVKVTAFLPHFVHDGRVLTSKSDALENPAARIVVYEDGKEVFRGWLFSLYPEAHAFPHPRYSLALVDFIPAG